MSAWTRFLAAVLAFAAVAAASNLVSRSAWAADPPSASTNESATPTPSPPRSTTATTAAPAPGAPAPLASAGTLPAEGGGAGRFDRRTALIGGLLMLAAAAIGLTITFRALVHDMRSRRRRYRRRVRREPDNARA